MTEAPETPNVAQTKESGSLQSDVDALVMPLGMKHIPLGWPMMAGAFIGFAQYAITVDAFLVQFQEDTGIDVRSIIPRNELERMIDHATGNNGAGIFSTFLDWLVVNHWGEA